MSMKIKRREFIALFGGAAAMALPHAAHAQQGERIRHISVLLAYSANDPALQTRVTTFQRRLAELGWVNDRNIKIDYHFAAGPIERLQESAAKIVSLSPELIMVQSNPGVAAILRETRSIPVVVLQVADPVGSGFVESIARPGGNITGFTSFEFDMGGKWLQLLKEIAPNVSRVAVLMHPETTAHAGFLKSIMVAAPTFGITINAAGVHGVEEIEQAIVNLAHEPNGGVIVLPHPVTMNARARIIDLVDRNRLPTIYPFPEFVRSGGLVSYGINVPDLFRRSAEYADRILRGAKPSDLPFQQPTKFEMVVNLKTAKAIGLAIPEIFLVRADDVIE
jgi:putative ABC transport system substrate-binding protein